MVTGKDSQSEGRGFESRQRKLDGDFSHKIVVKIVIMLERPKINEKEAGVGPFFKKIQQHEVVAISRLIVCPACLPTQPIYFTDCPPPKMAQLTHTRGTGQKKLYRPGQILPLLPVFLFFVSG